MDEVNNKVVYGPKSKASHPTSDTAMAARGSVDGATAVSLIPKKISNVRYYVENLLDPIWTSRYARTTSIPPAITVSSSEDPSIIIQKPQQMMFQLLADIKKNL